MVCVLGPPHPPGETWRSHLGRALEQARCVVVTWSEHSIQSDWVIEEAEEAKERGILVPVFLDTVRPPRGFRAIQAADLSNSQKDQSSPAVASFLAAVTKTLSKGGHVPEGALPSWPATSGNSLQEPGQGNMLSKVVSTADVQWPPELSGRRLALGGLGAIAVFAAGAFLVWLKLWSGGSDQELPTAPELAERAPQPSLTASQPLAERDPPESFDNRFNISSAGVGKGRILDVKGKVSDFRGKVLEIRGPVVDIQGRTSSDQH